jgi:hypothetical protein
MIFCSQVIPQTCQLQPAKVFDVQKNLEKLVLSVGDAGVALFGGSNSTKSYRCICFILIIKSNVSQLLFFAQDTQVLHCLS